MSTLYQVLSNIPILVYIKKNVDRLEYSLYWVKKEFLVLVRKLNKDKLHYTAGSFTILCVKRPEYVNLAIRNINSLHFHNPAHKVQIYTDTVCAREFERTWGGIDYPANVRVVNKYRNTTQPWQYLKIETLIAASKKNSVLIDADSIWYGDPQVSSSVITFLVAAYKLQDNSWEDKAVGKVFKSKKMKEYIHFVTGFVSIPSQFMTSRLENQLRTSVRAFFSLDFSFIPDSKLADSLKRLAEEIVISYTVQEMVPREKIMTLKNSDGPGNRQMIQSLYYGCSNTILE